MAKVTGFMEYTREEPGKSPIDERLRHWREFEKPLPVDRLQEQAARCMDCGIPFCHAFGCPVLNRIPDWCDMVYLGHWQDALEILHSTDNLPEITGRVCPAPCEAACTLAINQPAVSIRNIELQIVERGWKEGWIVPQPAKTKTGKRVAVVGSGPAGLSAAQQLARAGHDVVVFEKSKRVGGLLRFGIPDFKLEKNVIDRRLEQMIQEGVLFESGLEAGVDISMNYLKRYYDAVLLAVGAGLPRDLDVPGRGLDGVHFALDFLSRQNMRVAGLEPPAQGAIDAEGRHVVVIGGGDTGSDCVGTSLRQGCASLTQIEILPKPPDSRPPDNPWPTWPEVLRTSSSQEEGGERMWAVITKEFKAQGGRVEALRCAKLSWSEPDDNGRRSFQEIAGSEFEIMADLVLLAMGFVHLVHGPLVEGLDKDDRGNLSVDEQQMTSEPGVFAAGDAVMGASLVVRAIHSGREAAAGVDEYLRR